MASPWLHRSTNALGSASATCQPFLSLPANFRRARRNAAVVCQLRKRPGRERGVEAKGRKENVWSVDNAAAAASRRPRGVAGKRRPKKRSGEIGGEVMVSGAMLMEVETLLQAQEPVIIPAWNTFASSVSGIWKGVGAVFSPITARMEAVDVGSKDENLYDCYTFSRIVEVAPSQQIQRETKWVTLNSAGETQKLRPRGFGSGNGTASLPKFSAFDFGKSDVMEEDTIGNEPGLVFFEDGSYSRGPVDIPVGGADESEYYLSPTFKFEQCLVKGCHKRLRIVHTIEFSDGGSEIQILRVAVYEEQWVSPANIPDESDAEFEAKPFSQRKRTQPGQLAGQWKVFEVSATPIFPDASNPSSSSSSLNPQMVYFCTEALKKRGFPDRSSSFGDEEGSDLRDSTVMWLPGGVTAFVDVKNDGVLCIGVGWYSDEGINLVMERDYGIHGKLNEVRSKTEVKRRWSNSESEL